MKTDSKYKEIGILPKEEMLEIKNEFKCLNIGVPKESSFQENRVPLTPEAVLLLVNYGHKIIIENGAGSLANFSDDEYIKAGADVVFSKKEVFDADIIVKIEPPTDSEMKLLKQGQKIISAIQLHTRERSFFEQLINKNITSIAVEYIRDSEGKLGLLRSMSEIAGSTSLLIASEYLSNVNSGKGLMLGGVTGVNPTEVVIIGAGTVGEYACKTALGLGANVSVYDNLLTRLRRINQLTNNQVSTSLIDIKNLSKSLMRSDVVIGALRSGEGKTPCVVNEDMISSMKEGSVIIDVSIDHGGCFATSRVTSHKDPIFTKHGVIHYCVPNIPSRVSRTSSFAVSNIILPILIQIGNEGGVKNVIKKDFGIRKGVYTFGGMMTNKTLSKMFDLSYKDLDLITAAI